MELVYRIYQDLVTDFGLPEFYANISNSVM
jgi:hypothetical protein